MSIYDETRKVHIARISIIFLTTSNGPSPLQGIILFQKERFFFGTTDFFAAV